MKVNRIPISYNEFSTVTLRHAAVLLPNRRLSLYYFDTFQTFILLIIIIIITVFER